MVKAWTVHEQFTKAGHTLIWHLCLCAPIHDFSHLSFPRETVRQSNFVATHFKKRLPHHGVRNYFTGVIKKKQTVSKWLSPCLSLLSHKSILYKVTWTFQSIYKCILKKWSLESKSVTLYTDYTIYIECIHIHTCLKDKVLQRSFGIPSLQCLVACHSYVYSWLDSVWDDHKPSCIPCQMRLYQCFLFPVPQVREIIFLYINSAVF